MDCRVHSVIVPLVQTVQVYCDHGLQWSIKDMHNLGGICSLDILYLGGKSPLLMMNIQVNILPETSKRSAFWDMGVNSNLKWLPLFSPDEVGESGGTSLLHCMRSLVDTKCSLCTPIS